MTRRTLFRLLVAFTLVWLSWAGWSMVGRTHPYQLRVLDDQGTPVPEALVDSGGTQLGTTGSDGRVDVVWDRSTRVLEVSAAGHVPRTVTVGDVPEETLDVVLKARVLRGRVVDPDGDGLEGALVDAQSAQTISDQKGYFQIRGAEEGTVTVERAAWEPTSFQWDGGTGDSVVTLDPRIVKAVHIGGDEVVEEFDAFLQMAVDTELNALMIDLKDETGHVYYNTANEVASQAGSIPEDTFDLETTVQRANDHNLYVIGRIVLFNDPIAAVSVPEMAVWDTATDTPYEANGQYFLDPTDPAARQYGIDLAVEACNRGVDEIQFDYVRFPDSRRDSATFDGGVTPEVRVSTVSTMLSDAVAALRPLGCAVGADIFGYLTTATDDGGIGQLWEEVSGIVDVVSPMLYPSHFDPGWDGFEVPGAHPGTMVERSLADGIDRLNTNVVVRPWLQDFDYDANQVREQIAAVESFGLGWMLWNAASDVSVDALLSAEQ